MISYRSLVIRPTDKSHFTILRRLGGKDGYLQNAHQLRMPAFKFSWKFRSQLVKVFCSMKNLEEIYLKWQLTLEDLAHVFQSCSKITNLHIATFDYNTLEMSEYLKNQLRSGFQKLRRLDVVCAKDSWPVIQEMLT
jgi:hypothetical protein